MPTKATASNSPHYRLETVTYVHGTCQVWTPAPDGGSYVETVECPHRHTDIDVAQACAARMARARARELNRKGTR